MATFLDSLDALSEDQLRRVVVTLCLKSAEAQKDVQKMMDTWEAIKEQVDGAAELKAKEAEDKLQVEEVTKREADQAANKKVEDTKATEAEETKKKELLDEQTHKKMTAESKNKDEEQAKVAVEAVSKKSKEAAVERQDPPKIKREINRQRPSTFPSVTSAKQDTTKKPKAVASSVGENKCKHCSQDCCMVQGKIGTCRQHPGELFNQVHRLEFSKI